MLQLVQIMTRIANHFLPRKDVREALLCTRFTHLAIFTQLLHRFVPVCKQARNELANAVRVLQSLGLVWAQIAQLTHPICKVHVQHVNLQALHVSDRFHPRFEPIVGQLLHFVSTLAPFLLIVHINKIIDQDPPEWAISRPAPQGTHVLRCDVLVLLALLERYHNVEQLLRLISKGHSVTTNKADVLLVGTACRPRSNPWTLA
jgi:hypothetical protein